MCSSTPFTWVSVLKTQRGEDFEGVVAAQGIGLPSESTALPIGAASTEDVGWLRLEQAEAAGEGVAVDAGSVSTWTIVGPRGIGEIPAPLGERARVTEERVIGTFNPSHHSVVVTIGERIVLFHQNTFIDPYGERDGFVLTLGAAVCEDSADSTGCTTRVSHELNVTVPGGASGILAPGEAQAVGDYRVLHGDSDTLIRLREVNSATGQCSDRFDGPNQLTAFLLPGVP